MTEFERLVQAGIKPDCALDTCNWYRMQGDDSSLKRYVREVEERAEKSLRKAVGNLGV